jgi:hypothetical protein
MSLPWTTADYVFRLFVVLVMGSIALSPRPTLRLIFRRHADEASDERIRMLQILTAGISTLTAMEVILHFIGQPFP